jgi:hypothetical protein
VLLDHISSALDIKPKTKGDATTVFGIQGRTKQRFPPNLEIWGCAQQNSDMAARTGRILQLIFIESCLHDRQFCS